MVEGAEGGLMERHNNTQTTQTKAEERDPLSYLRTATKEGEKREAALND